MEGCLEDVRCAYERMAGRDRMPRYCHSIAIVLVAVKSADWQED
jgi:hypothetical protein